MNELLRLIHLAQRELDADDAHARLGGRDPSGEKVIWAMMGESWRIVVTYDSPPEDREKKQKRLEALLAPFAAGDRVSEPPISPSERHQLDLEEELDRIAERTGARAAVVIDERSPVVWGTSSRRADGWDVETMEHAARLAAGAREVGLSPERWLAEGDPSASELREAGVDETLAQRWSHRFHRVRAIAPDWTVAEWRDALQIARGVTDARERCSGGRAPERVAAADESFGVFGRGFAQFYLLLLIFDGPYSELHAEGPLVRALPHIESLVLALPPVEPPPRHAKVIAIRRP